VSGPVGALFLGEVPLPLPPPPPTLSPPTVLATPPTLAPDMDILAAPPFPPDVGDKHTPSIYQFTYKFLYVQLAKK
jgi:hypothetical protein